MNVYAVGRIEPNYVSLPVLAAVLCGVSCRFLAFSVFYYCGRIVGIAVHVEGFIIGLSVWIVGSVREV